MSKKAIIALCIAVLLPVASYLIVKSASENAVALPKRYFADSVINKVVDGKMVSDTVWHTVADITLINQLGEKVSLDDIRGNIIVADFFFTRCPSICPTLTRNMKELQDAMKMKNFRRKIDSSFVRFISFSVDPERDSADVLKRYADKYGVNHDTWWFLTGPKKDIYDFALNELKLGLQDGEGVDSNFIHTQKFVLMDKYRVVRGYYNGLDSASLSKLAEDLTILMLEKDKKKKENCFSMLDPVLVKNDKKARFLILLVSVIVFAAVVVLGRVQVPLSDGFDVHIFAKFNAVINSMVFILLVAGLVAVRNRNFRLHKKLMLAAMMLSVVFLVSYICHHLFAGDTKFGGTGTVRYVYYFILVTHIFLAAIILPFILFTTYRAMIAEWPQHRKLAKVTWPVWLYVSASGVVVYLFISPYYT